MPQRERARRPERPASRHRPRFRRRACLRGAANSPLLDRPVAPLRLHGDQHCPETLGHGETGDRRHAEERRAEGEYGSEAGAHPILEQGQKAAARAVSQANGTGDGLSTASTTQLTLPDIPAAPTFGTPTQTTATVNWNAPTGPSSGLTYSLARCTGSGCTNFSTVDSADSGTTFNDSGLSAGTTYTYKVLATNATGNGLYSATAEVTTSANPVTVVRIVRLLGHVRLRGHIRLL